MPEDPPSVSVFDWQPGKQPVSSTSRAATPGFTWIDADRMTAAPIIKAAESLGLENYHPQFVRHLVQGFDPDDPLGPTMIDHFEAEPAARLASGREAHLLQAFEPVFVEIGQGPTRRWSLVRCNIGFLAGNGWLITNRAQAWDVRFGGSYELAPTARGRLIDAARDYQRTDQVPLDVATLMVRHLARRSMIVIDELSDEIANRTLDLHRFLTEEALADEQSERLRAALFDLRWVLDALERATRRMVRGADPQAERWYGAARDKDEAAATEELFRAALRDARECRRNLGEALTWLTNENNSRALEQQAQVQEQTAVLQHLVGRVSIYLLGPALVAAVFGAGTSWFDDHQELRAAALIAAMILVAAIAAIAVHRLDRAPDQTIGPLGTPIYGWAWRLGAQINRYPRSNYLDPQS